MVIYLFKCTLREYELFLNDLKLNFQRHLDVISILEKKAQNMIIVSGILIGFNNAVFGYYNIVKLDVLYLSLPITVLFITVIALSLCALKTHTQKSPWNIPAFFKSTSERIPNLDMDLVKLFQIYDPDKIDSTENYMDSKEVKKKIIEFEHSQIKIYLGCCLDAIRNGKRISRFVKSAEKIMMFGIVMILFTSIIFILSTLSTQS